MAAKASPLSRPCGEPTSTDRKPHLFTRRHGQRYPTVVIGLASELTYGDADLRKGCIPINVKDCAVSIRTSHSERGRKLYNYEVEPGTLPAVLAGLCRRHRCVWLFGADLYRQLLAHGMFELIGPDLPWRLEDDAAGAHGGKAKKWAGFAALENNVTILVIRLGRKGILHCVDVKNYGLSGPPATMTKVIDRAAWTRQAVDNWIAWLEKNDMGSLQHTISSQAMYGFRMHLPNIPVLVHDHRGALGLERDALYGGRCEAFRLGKVKGPVYHLDFNSLYGAMAASCPVPVLFRGYKDNPTELPDTKGIDYIADVTVKIYEPFLPYRDTNKNLLLFPVGTFRTALCGPELELARPFILKIHRAAAYQLAPLFTVWANNCWRSRMEAREAKDADLERQLKLWSQVLYGKFGQQKVGWRHAPSKPGADPWSYWTRLDRETGEVEEWRSIAGRTEKLFRGGETHDSCPAIAAWITSLARVRLWQAILQFGRDNVLYTDTDSLWTTGRGMAQAKFNASDALGALGNLRIVARHRWAEFIGWKHYKTDQGVVCAGVRAGGNGGALDHGRLRRPESVRAACRRGRAPRAVDLAEPAAPEELYRHGEVRDGVVYPFRMGE